MIRTYSSHRPGPVPQALARPVLHRNFIVRRARPHAAARTLVTGGAR
ncbi:hypothetical protein YT1_1228 [Rhodococcus ruber]|nr:hypothetical protein YT1_1228 [Rhodococcus ruber]